MCKQVRLPTVRKMINVVIKKGICFNCYPGKTEVVDGVCYYCGDMEDLEDTSILWSKCNSMRPVCSGCTSKGCKPYTRCAKKFKK